MAEGKPDPKIVDELIRLDQALLAAQHAGEGVEEAAKAYRDYATWAASQGVHDGCTAEAFRDVLDDDE